MKLVNNQPAGMPFLSSKPVDREPFVISAPATPEAGRGTLTSLAPDGTQATHRLTFKRDVFSGQQFAQIRKRRDLPQPPPAGPPEPSGTDSLISQPPDSTLNPVREQVLKLLGGDHAVNEYRAALTEGKRRDIYAKYYIPYIQSHEVDNDAASVRALMAGRIQKTLHENCPEEPIAMVKKYLEALTVHFSSGSSDAIWPQSSLFTDLRILPSPITSRIDNSTRTNWNRLEARPRMLAVQEASLKFLKDERTEMDDPNWGSETSIEKIYGERGYTVGLQRNSLNTRTRLDLITNRFGFVATSLIQADPSNEGKLLAGAGVASLSLAMDRASQFPTPSNK